MTHYEERINAFSEGQRIVCHSRDRDVAVGIIASKRTSNYGAPQLLVKLEGQEGEVPFNAVDCAEFDEAWYTEYDQSRRQASALHARMQQMRRQKFPPLEE